MSWHTFFIISLIACSVMAFQTGRAWEESVTEEMREKIVQGWLQDCTKPIVIRERGVK